MTHLYVTRFRVKHADMRGLLSRGPPGGRARYCAQHRLASHVCLNAKLMCQEPGCSKQAGYGTPDTGRAQYCATHRHPSHINLKSRPCAHRGCSKQPSYGAPGGKPTHCATHRVPGDIDLKNLACAHRYEDGTRCTTQAYFGLSPRAARGANRSLADEDGQLFCRRHRRVGHADVRTRKCAYPLGCMATAVHSSLLRDSLGVVLKFCTRHKPEGARHTGARARTCQHPQGCVRLARYGDYGGLGARFCQRHCEPQHRNLKTSELFLPQPPPRRAAVCRTQPAQRRGGGRAVRAVRTVRAGACRSGLALGLVVHSAHRKQSNATAAEELSVGGRAGGGRGVGKAGGREEGEGEWIGCESESVMAFDDDGQDDEGTGGREELQQELLQRFPQLGGRGREVSALARSFCFEDSEELAAPMLDRDGGKQGGADLRGAGSRGGRARSSHGSSVQDAKTKTDKDALRKRLRELRAEEAAINSRLALLD